MNPVIQSTLAIVFAMTFGFGLGLGVIWFYVRYVMRSPDARRAFLRVMHDHDPDIYHSVCHDIEHMP
jgi:hypothetical protein